MTFKHADSLIDDLALRIDAASDAGDSTALESLDTECAGLIGHEELSDALIYYFRSNVQDGLQSALDPQDWAWHQPHREKQLLYLRKARDSYLNEPLGLLETEKRKRTACTCSISNCFLTHS